jgi:hypothetical protein
MRVALWVVAVVFAASGCRTHIKVGAKTHKADHIGETAVECNVHDYPSLTDVPHGAKDLGKVTVSKQETDEATYEKLREEICKKGGDALSGMRWVKELGKISGPPTELEAQAWQLPQ